MPSSNPVIPKEKLPAYQRWEIGSLKGSHVVGRRNGGDEDEYSTDRQQARSQGYAEGYSNGMQQAANEKARLQNLLQTLAIGKENYEQQTADDLLDLALCLAQRIVAETIAVKREAMLPIVREAIRQLPQISNQANVHLNPADLELVRNFLPEEIDLRGLKLIADSKIERGGCRIDALECQVDATLAVRWKNVLESLSRDHVWLT